MLIRSRRIIVTGVSVIGIILVRLLGPVAMLFFSLKGHRQETRARTKQHSRMHLRSRRGVWNSIKSCWAGTLLILQGVCRSIQQRKAFESPSPTITSSQVAGKTASSTDWETFLFPLDLETEPYHALHPRIFITQPLHISFGWEAAVCNGIAFSFYFLYVFSLIVLFLLSCRLSFSFHLLRHISFFVCCLLSGYLHRGFPFRLTWVYLYSLFCERGWISRGWAITANGMRQSVNQLTNHLRMCSLGYGYMFSRVCKSCRTYRIYRVWYGD